MRFQCLDLIGMLQQVGKIALQLGSYTNNQAEYAGLVLGLEVNAAPRMKISDLRLPCSYIDYSCLSIMPGSVPDAEAGCRS